MILYFSGTGNSEYVAKRVGKALGDEILHLFDKIRSGDVSQIRSDSPWVVIAPTYAWRIPRIVQKWLERADLTGNRDVYFVMTCGGSIGSAGKYLQRLCATKNGTIWDVRRSSCRKITSPCSPRRHRSRRWSSFSKLRAS